jgi:hypothetical protein
MLIAEDEDSDNNQPAAEDVEGTAYRETLTSVDGFTRGQGGKVKFHKDTKKRRRENEELDGDVEMADGTAAPPKAKKKVEARFGHEFRAKVRLLSVVTSCSALIPTHRKLEVISRRVGWSLMLTSPSSKRRRRGERLASREKDEGFNVVSTHIMTDRAEYQIDLVAS